MSQADSLRHIAILWDDIENEIEELRKENYKLQSRVDDYIQRLDTEMSEVARLKYELNLRKGF